MEMVWGKYYDGPLKTLQKGWFTAFGSGNNMLGSCRISLGFYVYSKLMPRCIKRD